MRKNDILRFDVPVSYLSFVEIFESLKSLAYYLTDILLLSICNIH